MKTFHIFLLSVFVLFCCSPSVNAQKSKTTTTKSASSSNSSVDKNFIPVLEPSERILVLPTLEDKKTEKQPIEYSLIEAPASLEGEYTPLPSAGIATEFPASEQLGYFRIGVGNHRSFLGDLQLNILRKSTQSLDANFKHRSVFGDLLLQTGDIEQAYFADNDLQLNYKAFVGNVMLDASLGEHFNFWNNYGKRDSYAMDTLLMPKGQWSTDGHYSFGLSSLDLNNPVSWSLKSIGHLFRLGEGVSSQTQQPAASKGGAESEFKLFGTMNYDVSNQFQLGLNVEIRNFSYRIPTSFQITELNQNVYQNLSTEFENRSYFELQPNAMYIYKNWRINAGIKLSIPSMVTESVRPNIIASAITALSKTLIFKAKLDGGTNPLSYREGFSMNPFLDPAIRLKSSWKPYDVSMSFEYRPVSNLLISPSLGLNTTLDAPFFYNCLPIPSGINNALGRYFSVEYMTSTQLHVSLDGKYTVGNIASFAGSIRYNHYTNFSDDPVIDGFLANNNRKAWYSPGVIVQARGEVNPTEKLALFVDYKHENLRYAPVRSDLLSGMTSAFFKDLGAINNLSLGANFNVSRGVGIFIHVNNLLDQRYEGYYGFPVHGFTAVIGGSVSF